MGPKGFVEEEDEASSQWLPSSEGEMKSEKKVIYSRERRAEAASAMTKVNTRSVHPGYDVMPRAPDLCGLPSTNP